MQQMYSDERRVTVKKRSKSVESERAVVSRIKKMLSGAEGKRLQLSSIQSGSPERSRNRDSQRAVAKLLAPVLQQGSCNSEALRQHAGAGQDKTNSHGEEVKRRGRQEGAWCKEGADLSGRVARQGAGVSRAASHH